MFSHSKSMCRKETARVSKSVKEKEKSRKKRMKKGKDRQ